MAYQSSLFVLLREIIVLPVAPWALRILLYYEGQETQQVVTQERLIAAVQQKFTVKLGKAAPTPEQISTDISWLLERQLLEKVEEDIRLSSQGRDIAKELTPAVSTA